MSPITLLDDMYFKEVNQKMNNNEKNWYYYAITAGKDFTQYFKVEDYIVGDFVIKDDVLIKYRGNNDTVQIPSNIRIIGYEAFSGAKKVRKIIGTPNVRTIACFAFYDSSLINFDNFHNLEEIGEGAFAYCSQLKVFNVPSNVLEIGQEAFLNCQSLKKITFNNTLRSINCKAFKNCYSLNNIELPLSVEEIGPGAFMRCESLQSIKLPNNLVRLGARAFSYCAALEYVEIGEKLSEIGAGDSSTYDSISDFSGGYSSPFCNCISIKKIIVSPRNRILTCDGVKLTLKDEVKIPCWSYFNQGFPSQDGSVSDGCYDMILPKGEIIAYCTNEAEKLLQNSIKSYICSLSNDNEYETIDLGCIMLIPCIINAKSKATITVNMKEKVITYKSSEKINLVSVPEDVYNNLNIELSGTGFEFRRINCIFWCLYKQCKFQEENLLDQLKKLLKDLESDIVKKCIGEYLKKCESMNQHKNNPKEE